jgi:chemotaxis protein CheX
MELIQPFINAADAVLAQSLNCNTRMGDVSMDSDIYRRKGVAALVTVNGDIEGRIIFDVDPQAAVKVANSLGAGEVAASDEMLKETVAELANLVIGNAVTALNDQGFRFKVHPPQPHTAEQGVGNSEDTEALVMCFETPNGKVFMNIAMRYNRRRHGERGPIAD